MEESSGMAVDQLNAFEQCRPLLASIAARILGGQNEVEDMLQEARLRWQQTDFRKVESPKAFLTATVARLCINHTNLARVRAERTGATVPADELQAPDRAPDEVAELADALAEGFKRMIARLSSTERVVFLLREAFEFDYEDIGRIVDCTEDNCRQILKRARDRIRHESPAKAQGEQDHIVTAFREAVETGQMDQIVRLLSHNAELVQDAGDLTRPAPPPARGAKLVEILQVCIRRTNARVCVASFKLLGRDVMVIRTLQGRIAAALLLETRAARICRIRLIKCPTLLRYLTLLSFDSFQDETTIPAS